MKLALLLLLTACAAPSYNPPRDCPGGCYEGCPPGSVYVEVDRGRSGCMDRRELDRMMRGLP